MLFAANRSQSVVIWVTTSQGRCSVAELKRRAPVGMETAWYLLSFWSRVAWSSQAAAGVVG